MQPWSINFFIFIMEDVAPTSTDILNLLVQTANYETENATNCLISQFAFPNLCETVQATLQCLFNF